MIIDALTITGMASAASYLLMPLLMGREFLYVDTRSEPAPATSAPADGARRAGGPRARGSEPPLPSDCIKPA